MTTIGAPRTGTVLADGQAAAAAQRASRDGVATPRTLNYSTPYLPTTAAAAYCGFKTSGALRKAHLEGKIRPSGRRGGTGTWMWAVEDLDRFILGLPPRDSVSAGRPGTPSSYGGDQHGSEEEGTQVGEAMEIMDCGQTLETGGLAEKGRWIPNPGSGSRSQDWKDERSQEDLAQRGRSRRVSQSRRGTGKGQARRVDADRNDALRRLRGIVAGPEGGDR